MRKEGRIVTCDRCSEFVFLQKTDEKLTDGGRTKYNTYEALPEGWRRLGDGMVDLCPSCNKEYEDLMKEFYRKKPENIEKRERCKE